MASRPSKIVVPGMSCGWLVDVTLVPQKRFKEMRTEAHPVNQANASRARRTAAIRRIRSRRSYCAAEPRPRGAALSLILLSGRSATVQFFGPMLNANIRQGDLR